MTGARPAGVMILHPDDDVAVTLADLSPDDDLAPGSADARLPHGRAVTAVPRGHKVALRTIAVGESVRKYGEVIGRASAPIAFGEHVHTHNLAFAPSTAPHVTGARVDRPPSVPVARTFDGFRRADGLVGTRNYIGVLSSVNCSVTVGKLIAQAAGERLRDFPNVDGVVPLGHAGGCGLASGLGLQILQRTLRGYAAHPNFAGVLMVGLGCEVNQVDDLHLGGAAAARTLTIQESGGTTNTIRSGLLAIEELLAEADEARRAAVPLAELMLGLNCGGSDAYSGITANPALGVAADMLVSHGGTAVLGETPEIYGAAHLLTSRAVDGAVASRLLERLAWWEEYTKAHGGSLDENPSPGNKAGGLTTIVEKSLGAIAKGGSSPLRDVVDYADRVTSNGLVFMDTPGYDPVSVTGIVAGGAQVMCFTTGRGSVFGCKPTPSIKLCSNTATYRNMSEDMDLNCGAILDGDATVEQMGEVIFERVIATASGQPTASELLGYGVEEFAPWQIGAVL